jgi:hypothetical protein
MVRIIEIAIGTAAETATMIVVTAAEIAETEEAVKVMNGYTGTKTKARPVSVAS